MTIQTYLKEHKLITDGAFGTYYAEHYHTQEMPEVANLTNPQRVTQIHREYIEAGANLIRTNTFASNTVLLHADMNAVKENIKAAISLAKAAIQDAKNVYIAGDIGPIPSDEVISREELEEQYTVIAQTMIEQGVDVLTFETFYELQHILPAIKAVKADHPDIFIMVQFCVNQFGYSSAGMSAKSLLQEASSCEQIDAVGLNCGIGPAHMEQLIYRAGVAASQNKYRIALPNAGYPQRTRSRILYSDSAEYFAMKVAEMAAKCELDIAGGCCGTTPEFIRRLSQKMERTPCAPHSVASQQTQQEIAVQKKGFLYDEQGNLKTKKLIAVELAPPIGADDEKLLEAARLLQKADVDVLTFPDSPSGRTRVDSVLMAEKVRRETGMEVMPHICCRDKNAIAMRSLFLGAYINDISNMLIITGDPVPSVVRQTIKAVFNFDSVGLMKIAKDMNSENFQSRPLSYGGAINQGRKNLDVEISRVRKKMEAGAEFFLTQPIFSTTDADRVRDIKEQTGARILCGIMPLISRRNALFMKNEIAGITVSDEIIERYPENGTKEEGEAAGVAIAREIMEYTKDFADGYYFSFPFNRVYLLEQIMR